MAEEKTYTIKNLVTGYLFNLTKEECDKLVLNEPHNFKVIDEDYVAPEVEESKKSTVFEKVVIKNSPETGAEGEEWTVPQIKAKLDELKIDYPKSAKKAELLALLPKTAPETGAEGE